MAKKKDTKVVPIKEEKVEVPVVKVCGKCGAEVEGAECPKCEE